MTKTMSITIVIVIVTAAGWGQSLFAVEVKGKQRWPTEEANDLYLSVCSVVQQEFVAPAACGMTTVLQIILYLDPTVLTKKLAANLFLSPITLLPWQISCQCNTNLVSRFGDDFSDSPNPMHRAHQCRGRATLSRGRRESAQTILEGIRDR